MAISQEVYASLNILYASQAPSASDISLWQTNPSLTSLSWEETVLVFANSDAAKETYPLLAAPGAATDATRKQYVLEVFNNAYGLQEADLDAAEIDYWVNWLGQTNSDGSPADSDGNGIPNILDFPIVLNQFQPPAIQQALLNRAEVALDFAAQFQLQGITSFTEEYYNTSWSILETVTASAASVTAAKDLNILAAQAAAGVGNSAILTAGVDILTANSFLAPTVNNFGEFNATFNSGDKLTGSGTNPTLTVLNTGGATLNTGPVLPTMKGIETLKVVNTDIDVMPGDANLFVLGANVVGVKNVDLSDSTSGLILSNFQTAVEKVSVSRTAINSDVELGITIAGAALAGSEDTVAVTLDQVGRYSPVTGAPNSFLFLGLNPVSGGNGYEKISIASKGLANAVAALTATGSKEITITGDQDLLIAAALPNTATKLDASAFEGDLDVTAGNGTVDFVGGKGDDTFRFLAGTFTATDKVDGGEGANTLVVVAADAETIIAADANIKNIQSLTLSTGGTATKTLRADLIGDKITTVTLAAPTLGDYTIRFAAGANSVNVFEDTSFLATLNVEANGGGNNDSLTFTIDGDDPGTPLFIEKANIDVGNLNLNNTNTPNRSIEQLKLVVNNSGAGTHTIGAITLPQAAGVVETITITGNSSLTIGGAVKAEKLDASGLTEATAGTTGLTMSAPSVSDVGINLTGSTFDDFLIGSDKNDFISGGAGKDTITGGAGADQIKLGDGFDTVRLTDGTAGAVGKLNQQEDYTTVTDFLTGATATTTDQIQVSASLNGGGKFAQLNNFAVTAGNAVATTDVAQGAIVDYSTLTANFLRITGTGNITKDNSAQAGFNAAIAGGEIKVAAAGIDILTSYYDSANSQMVLGQVDVGGDSKMAAGDAFTIISRVTMTAADYNNFGNAQFGTFI
ncbi:MAG: hemolysin [Microcystis sp. M_OC_Ca_00000000_S217Cul]|uniref:beta strand repeat-containing protein n=1 Tax=unclassified Microcystis TaxID=2643300 RepID=UPI0011955DD3|nr:MULTISPECIES: hemolysin [unclassified Microcystis]TRT80311.1 MAG: hemolysin [Microcystis sp. M_OC_Ca_00000000_S217Cul]TRT84054.1 MAG: hemolysin [Microcystis sp. M_OC_Ca_00000000_C217Col]